MSWTLITTLDLSHSLLITVYRASGSGLTMVQIIYHQFQMQGWSVETFHWLSS